MIDEPSSLYLAIPVRWRCKAQDLAAVMEELPTVYPPAMFIRSDNGPDFTAQFLRYLCEATDTTSNVYIEPGCHGRSALRNPFIGRFGMSSSPPCLSPQLPRPNSWKIAGALSRSCSVHFRPSRDLRPWRQLNKEHIMCTTTRSHNISTRLVN